MPTTLLQVPRRTFGRLRGVPQVSRHLLWRLRGVPQVLRRTCWPLQHAINDILKRVSHSFVELTLCDTDIKPYRANPYVKRTPYRPYPPPRKKEYPDRSAPRQNAGKSDQTLRIINHLRARSNSAFREAWRPVGRVDISISLRPVKKMIIKNEG